MADVYQRALMTQRPTPLQGNQGEAAGVNWLLEL